MRRHRQISLLLYFLADGVVSAGIWILLNQPGLAKDVEQTGWFYLFVPLYWMVLYGLLGEYTDPYRKTRFKTLSRTFVHTAIGIGILFLGKEIFSLIDGSGLLYYFLFQFLGVALVRLVHLTIVHHQIQKGIVSFNTLLIGGGNKAFSLYEELKKSGEYIGYDIIGFVQTNGEIYPRLQDELPVLGTLKDIGRIIDDEGVEEVLVAVDKEEYWSLQKILNQLFSHAGDLTIKIIPDMYDILLGKVRLDYVYGAVLIEIQREIMPVWQRRLKRVIDVTVSVLFFLLFWWLFLYIAIRVRFSSEGPVFYQQERIGLGGKPFMIYKFRSMYVDAEEDGPQLSFDGDDRCTPWGRIMRKWRIDELPQFWNVIKGDMSLVGPRPEREYFIKKITERAPHYKHLLRVKPGITSWGQVKYGYASSVDEMIQRLQFDILYIENRSLALDFKILFYTIFVVIRGSGK